MLFDNGEEDDGKDSDWTGSIDDGGTVVVEEGGKEFNEVILVLETFDEEFKDDVSFIMLFDTNEDFNDREEGEKAEGDEEENLSEPNILKCGNSKPPSIFFDSS